MDESDRQLYNIAYEDGVHAGKRVARRSCDVCPARILDGESALIRPKDVLLREGIEN